MINITEVNIKIVADDERLAGYASFILNDCFLVHDVKIIIRPSGSLMAAMPSRRVMDHCPRCQTKNHQRARYCNHCGLHMDENRMPPNADPSKFKYHCDIAHPLSQTFRTYIEKVILDRYFQELEASKQPGYVCKFHDH